MNERTNEGMTYNPPEHHQSHREPMWTALCTPLPSRVKDLESMGQQHYPDVTKGQQLKASVS